MRNLLALLAALVLSFAGVGWYLDWYQVQSSAPSPGHRHIGIDINTGKIGEDLKKGGDKLLDRLDKDQPSPGGRAAESAQQPTSTAGRPATTDRKE